MLSNKFKIKNMFKILLINFLIIIHVNLNQKHSEEFIYNLTNPTQLFMIQRVLK